MRTPTGGYGVRFGLASGRQRRCIPDLWIDGQRAHGMEIDDIPASTVEGIELYSSIATVPFQFSTSGAGTERCGTVVVWSRPQGEDVGRRRQRVTRSSRAPAGTGVRVVCPSGQRTRTATGAVGVPKTWTAPCCDQ